MYEGLSYSAIFILVGLNISDLQSIHLIPHMMTSETQAIHVLDLADYSRHRTVTFTSEPYSSLAPSSLRFRPSILSLSTNNFSYARIGQLMGWYAIYPLPPSTPAPYDDSKTYGRISAWGYAEIIDSTVTGIAAGQTMYGYFPISSGTEVVRAEYAVHNEKPITDQIVILDEHRQHLWKIYNRYRVCAPLSDLEATKGRDSLGWDSLLSGPFITAYNLSSYAFAWDDSRRIHPSGQGEWSSADADLRNSTVVVLNASGKTAMAFAYALRNTRPSVHQPSSIIGVGSPSSLSTIASSAHYDSVVLNADAESAASTILSSNTSRIVLVDFGARPGANASWTAALTTSTDIPFTPVTVGGEVSVLNPEQLRKRMAGGTAGNRLNASLLREKGIEIGGAEYFDAVEEAFDVFKKRLGGVDLIWGKGVEGWEDGWERLCQDKVGAGEGLVYTL